MFSAFVLFAALHVHTYSVHDGNGHHSWNKIDHHKISLGHTAVADPTTVMPGTCNTEQNSYFATLF